MSQEERRGLTRRGLAKGAVLAAGGLALGADAASAGGSDGNDDDQGRRDGDEGLALVHGNIITLDRRDTRASAVGIRDGRIVEVGRSVGNFRRRIDLKGATVVPGL